MDRIEMGDKVRSYDFPGRRDCYVEGRVEAITNKFPGGGDAGCLRYRILVEKVVIEGGVREKDFLIGDYVFPPVNGTPNMFGQPSVGVEKVPG